MLIHRPLNEACPTLKPTWLLLYVKEMNAFTIFQIFGSKWCFLEKWLITFSTIITPVWCGMTTTILVSGKLIRLQINEYFGQYDPLWEVICVWSGSDVNPHKCSNKELLCGRKVHNETAESKCIGRLFLMDDRHSTFTLLLLCRVLLLNGELLLSSVVVSLKGWKISSWILMYQTLKPPAACSLVSKQRGSNVWFVGGFNKLGNVARYDTLPTVIYLNKL